MTGTQEALVSHRDAPLTSAGPFVRPGASWEAAGHCDGQRNAAGVSGNGRAPG
jgi:hypothetical protein